MIFLGLSRFWTCVGSLLDSIFYYFEFDKSQWSNLIINLWEGLYIKWLTFFLAKIGTYKVLKWKEAKYVNIFGKLVDNSKIRNS